MKTKKQINKEPTEQVMNEFYHHTLYVMDKALESTDIKTLCDYESEIRNNMCLLNSALGSIETFKKIISKK